MGNQRSDSTKGGYVYMVVWGEQVIPMMRIPTIGKMAFFNNSTGMFVEGRVEWSITGNTFMFTPEGK